MAERTIVTKFDGDTKGLAAAARRGERAVEKFQSSVDRKFKTAGGSSADSFAGGFDKGFQRSGIRAFAQSAISGAASFVTSMQGALKGNAWVMAAIGVALLATMPVLGATAAGLLVAAFGAGIAGIGLVFAAQSERVKNELTTLKDYVVGELKRIAKPFEQTWLDIAGYARDAFDTFAPALEDAFAQLAPVISRFADFFFEGMEQFAPAIEPLTDAFAALLDAIGPQLPVWMEDISNALIAIANTVKENPEAFAAIIGVFMKMATWVLNAINVLARLYTWFTVTLPNAVEQARMWIVQKFSQLTSKISGFFGRIRSAGAAAWRWISDRATAAKNWIVGRWRDIQSAASTAAGWVRDRWNGAIEGVKGFFRGLGSTARGIWDGIVGAAKSAINGAIRVVNSAIGGINSVTGAVGIPGIPYVPYLRHGGTARAGRSYLVGEEGPELFTPGRTGRVTNATTTAEAMGGGPQVIENHIEIGGEVVRVVRTEISEAVRGTRRRVLAGAGGAR